MTSIEPTPITWTLRLKHQKKTVVLHVNPLQTFSSIKTTLLEVLHKTQKSDSFDQPLPSSADEIEFGKPIDPKDLDQGFTLGEWEHAAALEVDEETEDAPKAKGKKGRPSKSAVTTDESGVELAGTSNILQCPKAAGLKDGSVLVFRWGKKGDEEDDIEMEEERERDWDVTIPSFDDEENEDAEDREGLPSRGQTEAS
jgi:hypothetical protein